MFLAYHRISIKTPLCVLYYAYASPYEFLTTPLQKIFILDNPYINTQHKNLLMFPIKSSRPEAIKFFYIAQDLCHPTPMQSSRTLKSNSRHIQMDSINIITQASRPQTASTKSTWITHIITHKKSTAHENSLSSIPAFDRHPCRPSRAYI